MAKPAHTRVTFSGHIGGEASVLEIFSFNLCFPPIEGDDDAAIAALEDIAAGCHTAFGTHLNPAYGEDTWLDRTRVASVDGTGHVVRTAVGAYVQGDRNDPFNGTEAKQPMPLQTALCVSLGTARAGATGKGRFFLPWMAMSLDPDDKRINEATAVATLNGIQDFLQACAAAVGLDPVVVSSKGYMSDVTTIRLGRVPDTMRSRRGDVPEGYVSVPLHP